jgi:PAS domain S-box-containing protein
MAEVDVGPAVEASPARVVDPIENVILRSMNDGVMTLERTGDIYTVNPNPAALRILGFREEDLRGRTFAEVFLTDPANDEFTDLFLDAIYHGLATTHREVQFKRPDGQILDLSVATSFLQIDECRPRGDAVVAVFRDITAFKNLERVRQRAVDHLSHELKTPLSIIAASVEMLKKDERNDTVRQKGFARIERNLDRLLGIQELVEEILHPPAFRLRSSDVAATVVEILKDIASETRDRAVTLTPRLATLTTDLLDPGLLKIVLRTLVKNAIEHTPDGGGVVITIETTPPGILLKVKDEGVGIPISDQEFVFDGFHHIVETDDYSSRKPYDFDAGGKGLELLRLKRLSQAGYFDIGFESRRCAYIPTSRDHCPGRIADCPHVHNVAGCKKSGGTTFTVLFRNLER